MSRKQSNATTTPAAPLFLPSLAGLDALLRHDQLPQAEARHKVLLLDKPRVDNLPLRVGVVEADLRVSVMSVSTKKEQKKQKKKKKKKEKRKKKKKKRHTSNRLSKVGTSL